jgi:hypothetical protein
MAKAETLFEDVPDDIVRLELFEHLDISTAASFSLSSRRFLKLCSSSVTNLINGLAGKSIKRKRLDEAPARYYVAPIYHLIFETVDKQYSTLFQYFLEICLSSFSVEHISKQAFEEICNHLIRNERIDLLDECLQKWPSIYLEIERIALFIGASMNIEMTKLLFGKYFCSHIREHIPDLIKGLLTGGKPHNELKAVSYLDWLSESFPLAFENAKSQFQFCAREFSTSYLLP